MFSCGLCGEVIPQLNVPTNTETQTFHNVFIQFISKYGSRYPILESTLIKKYLTLNEIQLQKCLAHTLYCKLTHNIWCRTADEWK